MGKKLIFLFFLLYANEKVFIKGGEFKIPQGKTIYVKNFKSKKIKIKSFFIDKYEVSYKEIPKKMYNKYKNLVPDDVFRLNDFNLPIYSFSYETAKELCKLKGGRLPSEDEWIVAAGIKNGKFYKNGVEKFPNNAAFDYKDVNETLKNVNGLYGIIGNVWEMVQSKGEKALLKGGSFYVGYDSNLLDVRVRNYILKENIKSSFLIGFRCAYDN